MRRSRDTRPLNHMRMSSRDSPFSRLWNAITSIIESGAGIESKGIGRVDDEKDLIDEDESVLPFPVIAESQ